MWLKSETRITILAPMDGYTDSPFRQLAKRIEPDCIVFTEFISARELAYCKGDLKRYLAFEAIEQPLVVQLYGKDPADFARAAYIAESKGAAGIDINMGCPSKKVVAHSHGSALMQDINLSCSIIEQVKNSVSVPVSVKTRLGWEHHHDLIPFALKLQEVGLDGITIHGRTYAQKFDGLANWDPIYELKNHLNIPVFGNGDIESGVQAQQKIGNLNGVMIGRSASMDPWILKEVHQGFSDLSVDPEKRPTLTEQLPFWLEYLEKTIAIRGEMGACRRFRKYLVHLVKKWNLSSERRDQAIRVKTYTQAEASLEMMANDV